MAIITLSTSQSTSYNKVTDTKYVYEVTYYFDEDTKMKFKKRRVIGKVDPQTGETIPTGRVRKEFSEGTAEKKDYENLYKKATRQYERQHEFDRNAKAQLTTALRSASKRLDEVISNVKKEKENIERLLLTYDTENRKSN